MCKFISFWHQPSTGDIAIWDLTSHSDTKDYLKLDKTWREAHYTPNGELELRFEPKDHKPEDYEGNFRERFLSFKDFLVHCLARLTDSKGHFSGPLYVRGCDLKGVNLPESIGGSLDVSGCDLKGVKLPESIGDWLDVRGCDLKGIDLSMYEGVIK